MQVRKWWIYKTRAKGGALIEEWANGYWSGWVWWKFGIWLCEAQWHIHGNVRSWLDPVGKPLDEDLATPIISARDLVFRKLNPPTALVAAVEAKRAEEVLFDQGW